MATGDWNYRVLVDFVGILCQFDFRDRIAMHLVRSISESQGTLHGVHVSRNGWRCDDTVLAQCLLNLAFVPAPNRFPPLAQNLNYRRGLSGRPVRWHLKHARTLVCVGWLPYLRTTACHAFLPSRGAAARAAAFC